MRESLLDWILSMWVFLSAFVLVGVVFLDAVQRTRRWLGKLGSRRPSSVDLTLNQIYGDVHTHDRDYFDVAATEAMRQHYKGGRNG